MESSSSPADASDWLAHVVPLLQRIGQMGRREEGLGRSEGDHPRWREDGASLFSLHRLHSSQLSIGRNSERSSSSRRSEGSFGTDLDEDGPSDAPETPTVNSHTKGSSEPSLVSSPSTSNGKSRKLLVAEREDELAGLLVGFAFALQ